jgi:hypothetical protein
LLLEMPTVTVVDYDPEEPRKFIVELHVGGIFAGSASVHPWRPKMAPPPSDKSRVFEASIEITDGFKGNHWSLLLTEGLIAEARQRHLARIYAHTVPGAAGGRVLARRFGFLQAPRMSRAGPGDWTSRRAYFFGCG